MAELVELDAQPDQVLKSIRVHLAGHDRGHRRVARHGLGGVAVQPRTAVTAARRGLGRCAAHCARTRVVHSSISAELPSSTMRSAREMCAQA